MAEDVHIVTVQEPILLEIVEAPVYYIISVPPPGLILPADLAEYPDDEAAKADGLEIGDWYLFSEDSDVGQHGSPKKIMS